MSRKSSSKSLNNDANEKNLLAIREFQAAYAENKKCFECDQRGPTYVDMTIGSFVCSKCSGMLRGITPPHRIKSISMSSFSSDEVDFLKSRGNVWCSKVWLGLYDKARYGALDTKDDDAMKNHIIQKYEKKSYYVDPSTVKHTSGSGFVDVSAPAASSTSQSTTSGFIGTTLNRRSANTGSEINRPTVNSSSLKPKANNGGNIPGSSGGLTGLVLPPPVVDPFSPIPAKPISAAGSSAKLPETIPKPISTPSSQNFAAFQPTTAVSNAATAATESFANFDAAQFDLAADPMSKTNPSPFNNNGHALAPTPGLLAPTGQQSRKSTTPENKGVSADRYAALKDLDDIFKSTVVVSDGKTTGTSIFGNSTSPMAEPATPSSMFGGKAPNGSDSGFTPHWTTDVAGQNANSSSSGWPDSSTPSTGSGWPITSSTSSSSPAWPSSTSTVTNSTGWATAWPATTTTPSAPLSAKKTAANPFSMGNSNMTQLNTSPWPTTGTSPVQNSAFGAAGWPGSNTNQTTFDPFGAAPGASNLSQSENNNDLFAKAPKPTTTLTTVDNNAIDALTKEIFGNASAPKNNNADFELNPWATTTPAFSNNKNPFLS